MNIIREVTSLNISDTGLLPRNRSFSNQFYSEPSPLPYVLEGSFNLTLERQFSYYLIEVIRSWG